MASLEAFDRHLTGPLAARRCIDPNKSATLVPKHTDGVCAIDKYDAATGEPIEVHGITVWQTVAAAESSWAEAA